MKCPHCKVDFHDRIAQHNIGSDADGYWVLEMCTCPACDKLVMFLCLHLKAQVPGSDQFVPGVEPLKKYLIRPKVATRLGPPSQVPSDLADDYREASLVLADSPKASAALSRRCLQSLLRKQVGVKKADLAKEIEEVIASGILPSYLSEAIDVVRIIGNFAAHPIKATSTGEILPVELGEAEWILDVLDGLFDFYYVQPSILSARKVALDAKLASANKPKLK